MKKTVSGLAGIFALGLCVHADVVLMGQNLPGQSVLDGDFEAVKAGWRNPGQSPYWKTDVAGAGWGHAGFALGKMMNTGKERATFESVVLDHTAIKALKTGDVLMWRFASNTEYPCDGRVSLALVFGEQEHIVAGQVKVPNGPEKPQVFEGFYTVSAEDAARGMPKAKFTLETTHGILVSVEWFDLIILQNFPVAELAANAVAEGIELTWNAEREEAFAIYRSENERSGYQQLAGEIRGNRWIDRSAVNGRSYYYAVKQGASVSPVVEARKMDSVPPAAPLALKAFGEEWVVKLYWKTDEQDIAHYKIYRGKNKDDLTCIAPHVTGNSFEDMLPMKGAENVYVVQSVDLSGNESGLSETAAARVKMIRGAAFSDLILPMPIHNELRADVWGADTVKPRDPDNGVEDYAWSYWGGKVIEEGGKFHMNVVRWPEGHRKGHWAWPESTVAYVVSDKPTGPFKVVRDLAYDYKNGLGHNANIIRLNDGRYALYSLIEWKPMVFISDSIKGPWKLEGEIQVDFDNPLVEQERQYRYRNNLCGVQCKDGSFLMVTKAGAMMRSTVGILGPYTVLTKAVEFNETIPEYYRKSNYEDPTMWFDGVQYHMIINAFLDYRAIYLRSPDGVNWKYEQGLAYTPTCTEYEDGIRTFWYKVERPNVLQDEFGRATHLSLAAVDVPKEEDYGNDSHSSKHLILPLVVYKRLSMLNETPVDAETKEIRILIHSETGFDAANDLDLKSLRFGGSETVNFGGGAAVVKTEKHADGLVLIFAGENGLTGKNFVGKLVGQTKNGGLVVGYSKLSAE